jgi:hypothetical protein
MRFEPKTEEECAAAGLLPKGTYLFEVAEAKDKTSKAGNEMVELRLECHGDDDSKRSVFDYLVASDGSAPKIRQFAVCVGMLNEYERGELKAEDMIGRTGSAKIYIKQDKAGQYPDKNAVGEYLKPNGSAAPISKSAGSSPALVDDDIPFAPEFR